MSMRICWGCMLLVLLGLVGCDGRTSLTPVTSDTIVLCFGDSLTAGTGAGAAESYPAVLAVEIGCRVINAGVPGEVSTEGLLRLPGLLDRHAPGLVVLCHGGNDLLQQVPEARIAANLRAMVTMTQARGGEVILLAVPKPGLFLKIPEFYKEVAVSCNVLLERKAIATILSKPALKSDEIHPNAAGYRWLAEQVAALIGF